MQEAASWVVPHIQHVAQNEVANWAALYTYLLGLNHLNQAGMVRQVEAMTDSFWSQQHGIVQFLVAAGVALACVQVQVELASELLRLALSLVNERQEISQGWGCILFLDHIKAYDHVGVFGWLEVSINLTLAVVFSNSFETAADNFHGE